MEGVARRWMVLVSADRSRLSSAQRGEVSSGGEEVSSRHLCGAVARRGFALVLVLVLSGAATASANGRRGGRWVATWATSPQVLGPLGTGVPGAAGLEKQTVRDIVHVSAGGRAVRLRLTNRLGDAPVTFDAVRVGIRAAGAGLVPGSDRKVTFAGRAHVTVPDHAEVVSDPVVLRVAPDSDVAISVFSAAPTGPPTAHSLAQQTNYIAAGDATADVGGGAFTTTLGSWYFV